MSAEGGEAGRISPREVARLSCVEAADPATGMAAALRCTTGAVAGLDDGTACGADACLAGAVATSVLGDDPVSGPISGSGFLEAGRNSASVLPVADGGVISSAGGVAPPGPANCVRDRLVGEGGFATVGSIADASCVLAGGVAVAAVRVARCADICSGGCVSAPGHAS